MSRALVVVAAASLAACAPAEVPLAGMTGKSIALVFDDDGLISSPPMLETRAALTWDDVDTGDCPRAAPLYLRFADAEFEAYQSGGTFEDDDQRECLREADFTGMVDVSSILDAESAAVEITDDEDSIVVEVAHPALLRTLTSTPVRPGDTAILQWSPSTDGLPDTVPLTFSAGGAPLGTVDATLVDGTQLTVTIPDTAPTGTLHVTAELEDVDMGVTRCEGASSCSATTHLFHRAEGDLDVE
jgi:hypothetical protein